MARRLGARGQSGLGSDDTQKPGDALLPEAPFSAVCGTSAHPDMGACGPSLHNQPLFDRTVMNILAPPKARLGIEIVHDLVCPWCFLGVRRLMRTLRRRPDLLFELTWRPFLLNPDMPRAGMARPDYVIRKFGGEDRARRLYASISEIGRAEGIQFRFDRIRRTPCSVDA